MFDVLARYSLTTLSLWTVIAGILIAGAVIGGYLIGRRERAAARPVRGTQAPVEAVHRVDGPPRYRNRPVKPSAAPAPAVRRAPARRPVPRSEVLGRHAVEIVDTHLAVPAVPAGRHHRREAAK